MSCLYCGGTEDLGRDHIVPRSRGGTDVPENIVRACRKCNSSRGDRLPSEWRDDLGAAIYELERRALNLHSEVLPRKRDNREQKSEVISVCCTEDQKSALETVAASEGMGVSTWLLSTGLRTARAKQEKR